MSDFEQNFSLHNHSYYSDGENAIEEIVKEAEDCGLAFVGISDHLCLHPGKPGTMGEKDIERYVKRVREIDAKSKISVLLGAEVDVPLTLPEWTLCADLKQKYKFDYFIGSVHPFSSYEDRVRMKFKFDTDLKYVIKEHRYYWQQVYQLAQSELFEIMAHLDVYKVSGANTEKYLVPEISKVLNCIKNKNKIVEVNTSGFYEELVGEPLPSDRIVSGCIKRSIPLIISSDSHNSKHVVRDFAVCEKRITKLGGNVGAVCNCEPLRKIFDLYKENKR